MIKKYLESKTANFNYSTTKYNDKENNFASK